MSLVDALGLIKRFGDFTAVDRIDLSVAPGLAVVRRRMAGLQLK